MKRYLSHPLFASRRFPEGAAYRNTVCYPQACPLHLGEEEYKITTKHTGDFLKR